MRKTHNITNLQQRNSAHYIRLWLKRVSPVWMHVLLLLPHPRLIERQQWREIVVAGRPRHNECSVDGFVELQCKCAVCICAYILLPINTHVLVSRISRIYLFYIYFFLFRAWPYLCGIVSKQVTHIWSMARGRRGGRKCAALCRYLLFYLCRKTHTQLYSFIIIIFIIFLCLN